MSDLTWTADSATLGELVPWERNPKAISKRNAERLLDYWQRIGQFQTVAIGPGGEVYDGHQRLSVLKAAFGPSYRIDVRRASRALTEAERAELLNGRTEGAKDRPYKKVINDSADMTAEQIAAAVGCSKRWVNMIRRELEGGDPQRGATAPHPPGGSPHRAPAASPANAGSVPGKCGSPGGNFVPEGDPTSHVNPPPFTGPSGWPEVERLDPLRDVP